MPIKIPNNLPARSVLEQERIFVMDEERADHQDIRPLKIAILNLMPLKEKTETHLLRLLSNCALQIDITLLRISSYEAKNTSAEHLNLFYRTFTEVEHDRFDGLIITGAPIEHLPFEQVEYWPELQRILDWSTSHVFSTMHICWAAQAGLYHHYDIGKTALSEKLFGVFPHTLVEDSALTRGFDELFFAPHSRYTESNPAEIAAVEDLQILAQSEEAGIYLAATQDCRQIFITGHPEYDRLTLHEEYVRDRERGLATKPALHYYPADDVNAQPLHNWRGHAHLLFGNWLNYCVYQQTPYRLDDIDTHILPRFRTI